VEALFARNAVDHLHIATLNGEIVAYVLYCRGEVTNNPSVHVQGLTIMGVLPERQRQGIGTELLAWSVAKLRGACDALFVVGHPEFYARAGFVEARELGIEFSFPAPSPVCRIAVLGEQRLAPGVASYHPVVHEFF
jgi:putative acetyltransferase